MEKKPINYFKFVLDPVCFGTSIENMFCVSFLVEEGKMDISVCEEIGLAMIVPLSKKNKGGHEEKKVGRGGSERWFSVILLHSVKVAGRNFLNIQMCSVSVWFISS